MSFHCRCGLMEKDCSYPSCHNGESDSIGVEKSFLEKLMASVAKLAEVTGESELVPMIDKVLEQLAEAQVENTRIIEAIRVALYNAEEVMDFDECTAMLVCMDDYHALEEQIEDSQLCRDDGRCQYAIDHGAEGMGHCPQGKCCMPRFTKPKGI